MRRFFLTFQLSNVVTILDHDLQTSSSSIERNLAAVASGLQWPMEIIDDQTGLGLFAIIRSMVNEENVPTRTTLLSR